MNKLKKAILITLIIIVSIIVLGVLIITILNRFTSDISPINDSDLQLGKVAVSQEENSYYDLIKIKDVIYWQSASVIYQHLNGEVWDEEFVKDLLSKNKQAFEYFDQAAKKPKFQDPAFDDQEKFFEQLEQQDFKVLSICREMGVLSAIRALYLAKDRKKIEALEEIMKTMKIGQQIQDSQFPSIHYLTAHSMKDYGAKTMQRIISLTELSPEILISYIQKLEDFKKNEEGLKTLWKGEYSFNAKFFGAIASGKKEQLKQLSSEFDDSLLEKILLFGNNNFYFRPNKTKLLFAEYIRSIINDVEKPYGLTNNYNSKKIVNPSSISVFFVENAVGKMLFRLVVDSLNTTIIAKYNEDLSISATQLIFAIKAYKAETGDYPTDLNLLALKYISKKVYNVETGDYPFPSKLTAPKYISTAIKDPFDGKAIRYSLEKRIIYSVGKDLVDDSGDNEKDVVFKIEF